MATAAARGGEGAAAARDEEGRRWLRVARVGYDAGTWWGGGSGGGASWGRGGGGKLLVIKVLLLIKYRSKALALGEHM
jgi:hypothetical protein